MNPPAGINYDFSAPSRIVFGWGRRHEAGNIARELGTRAFIVCGSRTLEKTGGLEEIIGSLHEAGVETVRAASISREPLVEDVDRCVAALRDEHARAGDLLLAIGGGSAIDLAKAAAALIMQERAAPVRDYLEGVGKGRKIVNLPLPVLAMPTTAGTGSEATKNSVISSNDPPFKKSLRSALMVPRAVLIDPELAVSVPPQITAWTGMDTITQLIESLMSIRATPATRTIAMRGLSIALPTDFGPTLEMAPANRIPVLEAYSDGESRPARERMAQAALLSGIALANSGLGMAHAVAAALGVHCHVPHGLACAVMLPEAMWTNFKDEEVRSEFELTAMRLLGPIGSALEDLPQLVIDKIDDLVVDLNLPRRLSEIGVRREQIPVIVRDSHGNSMSGNPRKLSDRELTQVLENML